MIAEVLVFLNSLKYCSKFSFAVKTTIPCYVWHSSGSYDHAIMLLFGVISTETGYFCAELFAAAAAVLLALALLEDFLPGEELLANAELFAP